MKKELLDALARQQSILDVAKNENRDLTADEKFELDTLQKNIKQADKAQKDPNHSGDASMDHKKAVADERRRITEIYNLCKEFGLESRGYIDHGSTTEDVRSAVLEHLRMANPPIASNGSADLQVTADSEDKFRAAMADALVMRGGVQLSAPVEGAQDLMGMSLRDLAIETLQKCGETGLNRQTNDELFSTLSGRAYFNPTNAFPTIMDTAINKAYVEGHRTVAVTFDKWTKKGTLSDFKTHDNNYLAGAAGEFLEVPEGSELKHDIWADEKRPTRKLKTYGRQFTMTRQAFINDDIGFLSSVPAKYAASARKTLNKQCYQILTKNPAIYDGTPLFSSIHKNVLTSGTGITKEAVQRMFMALQMQKDEFGEAIIVRPSVLVVPVGYTFDMYELFYSPTIHTSANAQTTNPLFRYRETIEIVEDPTINVLCDAGAMPWFVLGDKSDTDFVEVDYLNGQEIPSIRRMESAGTLGFVWDIYLDWGISVMDWRGAIKNPGISISSPLDI